MSLQSNLFKGDRALEACAVSDAAHVTPGAAGEHVSKIQSALIQLDQATISGAELSAKKYGPSTAAAVLAFKQKRRIINFSYQTQADNIVGKMTVAALDRELAAAEGTNIVICSLPEETGTTVTAALVGKPPAPVPVSDSTRALSWVAKATLLLDTINTFFLSTGARFPKREFDIADTHFHQRTLADSNDRIALLRKVRSQFGGIQTVLSAFASFSKHAPSVKPGIFANAPLGGFHLDTTVNKITIFDPIFGTCGPNCRAAMLVHECAHYVASAKHFAQEGPTLNGRPDCPDLAVKNPDGSCKKHPRNYRDLKPDEAALNACTYAAFAFHAFSGQDLRPGAFRIKF